MPPQTRKTVLKRIRSYLRNNPSDLKGVRSVQANRLSALIARLNEFSPIETLNWNRPERKLFREVAVAAGIQFVRDYPMLYHTPNSLRACFGMPTRNDRKKGRYSFIYYRNEAFERQLRPRYQDLEELLFLLSTENLEYPSERKLLIDYIDKVKSRKWAEDLIETPESDHSVVSIANLRNYLESQGFKELREATEEDEEVLQDLDGVILAPDMIGRWKEKLWWIELKEYRELSFNSKVVYQVFRYLYQNPFVILFSISPLPSFTELLDKGINQDWSAKSLREWASEIQETKQQEADKWSGLRKTFLNLGRELSLAPRIEALYLALTNEIVTREIGLIGTEQKGIDKFISLLENFRDKPIKICLFEKFIKEGGELLQNDLGYCLLLKMDFPIAMSDNSD
ncbi:hypothetical protein [Candidatus Hodarchaeum mangrovi]